MRFHVLTFALVCTLMSGCALWSPDREMPVTPEESRVLSQIKGWRLTGRIAVRDEDGGWHANLEWSHRASEDSLLLTGPLGQGVVSVVLSDQVIRITRDGETEVSERPAELLRERLGFSVPLSALAYWVLGLARPQHDFSVERYPSGRLQKLVQMGWRVSYDSYRHTGQLVLPEKMVVRGQGLTLKLVIDEWRLNFGESDFSARS